MQTRIIAGKNKGLKLNNPINGTRPLTDRIKTSVFDLIKDFIPNASILDLYAGGGNFGIEALSRGAKIATFVDLSNQAIDAITDNVEKAGLFDQAIIMQSNVEDFVRASEEEFDIIMADPPFNDVRIHYLKDAAKLLKSDGVFIFRHPIEYKAPEILDNLKMTYQKEYGKSIVSFYQETKS